MGLKFRDAVVYSTMPAILPRIIELFPDTKLFAGIIASVFANIGLLPQNHMYLSAASYRRFGVRDVMAAAAHNLTKDRKHLDQWFVYGAFVIGIVILLLQFTLLIGLGFVSAAKAAVPFTGIFDTVFPENDVALGMLDKIFGIEGFFNTCYDPIVNAANSAGVCAGYMAPTAFPTTFQSAMQELFRFYSNGILLVGIFIVIYYIFAMLVETINTGKPLGNRYQSVYTPLRLVIAVCLLTPLAHGYNAGQYAVLQAAKMGSGFATNSWLIFNEVVTPNPLGLNTENLIGAPKGNEITSVVNFMYIAKTCAETYNVIYKQPAQTVKPYIILNPSSTAASSSMVVDATTSYSTALTYLKNSSIAITFGAKDAKYTNYPGLVKPYCGQIVMPVQSLNVTNVNMLYEAQFNFLRDLWYYDDFQKYGQNMAIMAFPENKGALTHQATTISWGAPNGSPAAATFYINVRSDQQSVYSASLATALNTLRTTANPDLDMDNLILNLGWGGAGMWFNKVASINGAVADANHILPTPTLYPLVMEFVAKERGKVETTTKAENRFSPQITGSDGKVMSLNYFASGNTSGLDNPSTDIAIATLLSNIYDDIANAETTVQPKRSGNTSPVKALVTFVMGDSSIFDMIGNNEVFPLARMAILGRSLIDRTVILVGGGTLMVGLGGLASGANDIAGKAIASTGDMMLSMAMVSLTIGFVLYYLIPLLPFMYFFIAVGRWAKSIFEAMVAVPLWALSHIRLGGTGLVGENASAGYFMILEILFRPIFTLFGLLAALTVFAAMAATLDSIWTLVVYNVGGFDMDTNLGLPAPNNLTEVAREALDELFYTVMYTIILYMMALSCFKLIDIIPSQLMRYLGFGGRSFNDQTGDIGGKLIQNTAIAGYTTTRELKEALQEGAAGFGSMGGQMLKSMKSKNSLADKMKNN